MPTSTAWPPAPAEDQGRLLQKLLGDAAAEDRPLFVPPGRYLVANVTLPARTRLVGIAGATELVFAGDGHMFSAENAERIELCGLIFDGGGQTAGRLRARARPSGPVARRRDRPTARSAGAARPASRSTARPGGSSARTVTGAHDAGIRAIESTGLVIADNTVSDCGNGGILVWRWNEGEDGTIVTGNRVERIAAKDGGTGENGNGINVFRADGVIVANNRVTDCAFTAVRANSASNVQILGNNCRNSGEVGIYSEFAFSGALIANNIVDRAATGISVANFREGGRMAVVAGNIVRNIVATGPYQPDAPGFGVGISVEADVAASGNIVDGAPLYGMMLGWGPYLRDVAATGNVIRRAPIGIAVSVVEGSGSAVISDNLIAGADARLGHRHALGRRGLGRSRPLGRRDVPASPRRAEPGQLERVGRRLAAGASERRRASAASDAPPRPCGRRCGGAAPRAPALRGSLRSDRLSP